MIMSFVNAERHEQPDRQGQRILRRVHGALREVYNSAARVSHRLAPDGL